MSLKKSSALLLSSTILLTAACSADLTSVDMNGRGLEAAASAEAPFETSDATVELALGDTHQLDLTKLANGKDVPMTSVKWSSSNELVASVTDGGLVTAVGGGEALVSATRGIHVVSVTIRVSSCGVTPLPVGTTNGEVTAFDCWFAAGNRFGDYYSVAAANGEVMRFQTGGIAGVTGIKAATLDLATGTVFGSRSMGATYRVIGNGDPLQFYVSGATSTTFGAYSITRSVDPQAHSCGTFTFVVPGASFAADMQPTNACHYNVAFTNFPPALGKPIIAHRYWIRVDAIKPYTVTVGGVSFDFDPAVTIFPNILNAPPVASALPDGNAPSSTRSVTFTPPALGYYLIEVSTGTFRGGIAPENWVNHTGPFTVSVSR